MQYSSLLLSVLVLAALMLTSCLGQIHFSPDWQPGKRSGLASESQFSDTPYTQFPSSSSSSGSGNSGSRYDTDAIMSLFGGHMGRDVHACAEQIDYQVLLGVAKILAREANRLSSCMKGC
ncbi:hypothetical protein EGW08_015798 [Elysia chlorotica]|uniref:Uncharacterized protein n=1 Tax=Elysia chlorotica TaxID=188477 RepID=A0A3S0ZVQ7_ELYCH|nr:hypothetical protein EGW08_015798 [Elysia chlorotica]